jgi:TonB family protein
MLNQSRRALSLLPIVLVLTHCLSIAPDSPTEYEELQNASDAYLAYERGDCASVDRMSSRDELRTWKANENHYSMLLLRSFCQEISGDAKAARNTYEDLVEIAPDSFAGRDARERLRILVIEQNDPNGARWLRESRERAMAARSDQSNRAPVERRVADFPPVPRAAGIEGYALVEFGVTPRGQTTNPVVVESSPRFIFDGASIRAVRRWQYARSAKNDRQVIRLLFRREASSGRSQENDDPSPGTETEPAP